MGNLIKLLPLILFLIGCGKNIPVANLPVDNSGEKQTSEKATFLGEFTSTQSEVISLSSNNKPTVLVFASDICAVCSREARHFSSFFENQGGLPKNINFYTLMIGSDLLDAVGWQDLHNAFWVVGYQPGDTLFRQYCPELKTPCTVVFHPENKKLSKFVGELAIEELEEETGKWEF